MSLACLIFILILNIDHYTLFAAKICILQLKIHGLNDIPARVSPFLYSNMCTYNAISSHTDHFEIQKRDSEESLLTFVNLFPRNSKQCSASSLTVIEYSSA